MAVDETNVIDEHLDRTDSDKREYVDRDGFYKDLIERFFYPLLKRATPELYKKADITKKPRFLDKEFRDILNTGDPKIHKNPHFADFVLEVPLKNKKVEWILLHIEAQQSAGGRNLAERMNHYRCLIYAHYRKEPVALAIITSGKREKERFYSHTRLGTRIVYRYKCLVLTELDDKELLASDNTIDLVLYAAKCAMKAKKEHQKYKYLRTLLEILSERDWSKEDKRDLLLFLERVMDLRDKELEKQYTEYRHQLTKEGKILFIPLGERELAREIEQRGMERGMEKGKEEMARNLMANGIPPDIIAKSAGLPVERIRRLVN